MMIVRSGFRFALASLALAALVALPMGCASWGAGVYAEGGNASYDQGQGRGHGKAHPAHPLGGPPGQMKKHGKKHGHGNHKGHDDSGVSVSVEGTIRP